MAKHYILTFTVVKVALVVLRAGKDDGKAVYKAISEAIEQAFCFIASPKVTLISGHGFQSKIFHTLCVQFSTLPPFSKIPLLPAPISLLSGSEWHQRDKVTADLLCTHACTHMHGHFVEMYDAVRP